MLDSTSTYLIYIVALILRGLSQHALITYKLNKLSSQTQQVAFFPCFVLAIVDSQNP